MPRHHPLLDDPDWLWQEYIGKHRSLKAIGRPLGHSQQAVSGALKRHGITIRSRPNRIEGRALEVLSDRDELLGLYRIWSEPEIAEELGVSVMVVSQWVRRHRLDPNGVLRRKHLSRSRKRACAKRRADIQRHRRQQARILHAREAQGERERDRLNRLNRLIVERRRADHALAVAIATIVLQLEQQRVEEEAAPLVDVMREWQVANASPLVTFRLLLADARTSGAPFDIAFTAALGVGCLNGFAAVVKQQRHIWCECYERRGRPLALSARILD